MGIVSMHVDKKYCNVNVAKKITYEFEMFKYLCGELDSASDETEWFIPGKIVMLGSGVTSKKKRRISPLLESLLLHTRVLRDFFYESRRQSRVVTCPHCGKQDQKTRQARPDDVFAEDFVPNWKDQRPALGSYVKGQRDRLNKALAHLTIARVQYTGDQKRWNITAIREEIQPVIDKFKACLPASQKPWFELPRNRTVDNVLQARKA
jgi:hypothetical protein